MDVIAGIVCLVLFAAVCAGYLWRRSEIDRSPARPVPEGGTSGHVAGDDGGDGDDDGDGDGGGDA